ncbi:MAG: hypothetical protein NZ954_03850 [Thermofilaceae archaeon]|nr:hypothetical protein [Thermofilaceae archaeon]MDW8004637.1 hypothetical protein [Thermofilaceae archaeon]
MLCYSLVFNGLEEDLNRIRSIPQMPIELALPLDTLQTLSIPELADPFLEENVKVEYVKLLSPCQDTLVEDLEKTVILADELTAEFIVLPVDKGGLHSIINVIDKIFESAVVYSKKIALEPSREALAKVVSSTNKFLGGVFKFSFSPTPTSTTDEVTTLALTYLGQLAAVKLVGFSNEGNASRISGASGINVFALIKELLESGYDGYFVLDYEPRGLMLPSRLVWEDCELLIQYINSLIEKRS